MLQHQDERGRASYSCAVGETHFWRRHPNKVANTLSFMLGRESPEFERVRGAEVEPLRECLQYLRVHSPHLRVHLSNAERFVQLYGQLQTVVPRGRSETPVRLRRTPRAGDLPGCTTLGETLGAETDVLVVVEADEVHQANGQRESGWPGDALKLPARDAAAKLNPSMCGQRRAARGAQQPASEHVGQRVRTLEVPASLSGLTMQPSQTQCCGARSRARARGCDSCLTQRDALRAR